MFALITLCFSTFIYAEAVWIDVRSAIEHKIDNIEGDLRISHGDIIEVTNLYPKKNTAIRLYCRSGGRAGIALKALEKAGYTNVQNIGGIDDARKARKPKTLKNENK
jgi:phage shock protein E